MGKKTLLTLSSRQWHAKTTTILIDIAQTHTHTRFISFQKKKRESKSLLPCGQVISCDQSGVAITTNQTNAKAKQDIHPVPAYQWSLSSIDELRFSDGFHTLANIPIFIGHCNRTTVFDQVNLDVFSKTILSDLKELIRQREHAQYNTIMTQFSKRQTVWKKTTSVQRDGLADQP